MSLIDAKFQSWNTIKENLETIVRTTDPQDVCVTIPYGLQLFQTLHHPHVLRCLTFYPSTAGDIYVTHIDTGACNEICVWTVGTLDEQIVKCSRFPIKAAICRLIFIPHHRVFVGFCSDMTLRTFSDLIHQCAELSQVTCLSTVLCMAYNEWNDELITGGHGCLQSWKMTHIELREPLTPGRPIKCQITEDDWVRDLQVDRKHHQLIVLCDEGVCIIDYKTNKQAFFIRNWHQTALTSCVFYRPLEYFITAAMDGTIKVWNAIVFSQVHEFIGHYDSVTGLVMHPSDPLLVSGSKDGTVRMWRLDTFELTQRLDVGEKILGLRLANHNQLFYYTLHDVKIYNFNQFHHMFTPVQSCIHKLARVKTESAPTRILCAAEDGGVRLISAISGTILTIIYPMATYQILTDLVYDPQNNMIYTAMATGDVLVFRSGTNPCTADQLWVPALPDECVLCLALVQLDSALGDKEMASHETLIFAGLNSGQIILLEASQCYMKIPVKAHVGRVTVLERSHGSCDSSRDGIQQADKLMSCGSDKNVCVWAIELTGQKKLQVKLNCLKTITCVLAPSHISMLGSSLCVVLPNNVIHIYNLMIEASFRNEEVAQISSNKLEGSLLQTHLREHDHTKTVTALCSCPSLGLFATTSSDGSVKLWDLTNTLVRELAFDQTLRSVCFANDRGDLLVGFQNHVSYVSVSTYLPLSYMEKLVGMDFTDEEIEEPVTFNPDLQLWFNIANLPTFPADVVLRRHMQQSMDHLAKYRKSLLPPRDRGDSEAMSTCDSKISAAEPETSSLSPTDEVKRSLTQNRIRFSTLKPSDKPAPAPTQASQEGAVAPQALTQEPERAVDNSQMKDEPSGGNVSIITDETSKDENVNDEIAAGHSEEKKEEEEEEEEEEFINPWPVAPDGYIPNSIIRSIMGYHHTLEPIPESPWKLKPLPSQIEESTSSKTLVESDSYDRHEPIIWGTTSSSSSSFSFASGEEDVDSFSVPANLEDEDSQMMFLKEIGIDKMSKTQRRKTLEKLELSGMVIPQQIAVPQEEKKSQRRRKSRVINAAETKSVGKKLKATGMSSEEEEEETMLEDTIPELLKTIAANIWFPKGLTLNVEAVISTLLDLLDDVADYHYAPVCQAVVQIYKELRLSDHLLEIVLSKYRSELKNSRAVVRVNAVKTLTGFGLDRRDVILSLLPALADNEANVRDETLRAVGSLAGIQDRSGLADYLDKIGILKPYHGQEMEVFKDLEARFKADDDAAQPRTTLHPSHIQLLARGRNGDGTGTSSIAGLPSLLPAIHVGDWLSEFQMELGRCPSGDDIFPEDDSHEQGRLKVPAHMKHAPFQHQGRMKPSPLPLAGKRRSSLRPSARKLSSVSDDLEPDMMWSIQDQEQGAVKAPAGYDRSLARNKRRNTLHVQLLQAHADTLGKQKVVMENEMQMKLRYHRERYETMRCRRQKEKKKRPSLVPRKAGMYSYYSKQPAHQLPDDDDSYETDTPDWGDTDLARAQAVIAAFGNMPSKLKDDPSYTWQLPSESGLGLGSSGLLAGGSSAPRFAAQRSSGGQECSSGFFTETDVLGGSGGQGAPPDRPKSKLTAENLQRHDAMFGKAQNVIGEASQSTKSVLSHQIQKNWTDFFSLPLVQRRQKQTGPLPSQNDQSNIQPIKCISSRVRVDRSHGERGQRLLDKVIVDARRVKRVEGQGVVFCTPVPEKLTVDTKNRSSGVSQYGNLDMIWTTHGPVNHKGHKVVSMTDPAHLRENQRCPRQQQLLQREMTYPSLYNVRVLDENRARHAALGRPTQQSEVPSVKPKPDVLYRWSTPEPIVFTAQELSKKKELSFRSRTDLERHSEVEKDHTRKEEEYRNTTDHIYLPVVATFDGREMPIAPHNSTISYQSSIKLPHIPHHCQQLH